MRLGKAALILAVISLWAAVIAVALGTGVPENAREMIAVLRDVPRTSPIIEQPAESTATAPSPLGNSTEKQPATKGRVRTIYPRIEPADGPAIPAVRHSFFFAGQQHTIALEVDRRVYWGARNSDRLMEKLPGESDEAFHAAWVGYVVNDPAQKPALDAVLKQLRAIRSRLSLDDDRYAELIAKYVQSLPYDDGAFAAREFRNRFPVETLVDSTGLCGDKGLLMGILLAKEGYDVAYLVFPAEEHAALGIRGPGQTYGSSGYLFLESTSPYYVSEVPRSLNGGIQLRSNPWVIPIGEGTKQYRSAGQVARILKARERIPTEAQRLAEKASSQPWPEAEWNAMVKQVRDAEAAYNTYLQAQPSATGPNAHKEYLDRAEAIRWLDRHGWWE